MLKLCSNGSIEHDEGCVCVFSRLFVVYNSVITRLKIVFDSCKASGDGCESGNIWDWGRFVRRGEPAVATAAGGQWPVPGRHSAGNWRALGALRRETRPVPGTQLRGLECGEVGAGLGAEGLPESLPFLPMALPILLPD